MVEQQKVDIAQESTTTATEIKKETKEQPQQLDIAQESTTTATEIKKETKEQPQQQEPSISEETQQQDNASGVETKDLK